MSDLIDKKALYDLFVDFEAIALEQVEKHMHDEDLTEWRKWSIILGERTAYRHDVFDAPTIDAEPIKHAKWNKRKGEYYCSKCQKPVVPYRYIAQDGNGGYREMFPNYCCWCGAKGEIGEDPSHPTAESVMMGD